MISPPINQNFNYNLTYNYKKSIVNKFDTLSASDNDRPFNSEMKNMGWLNANIAGSKK